MRSLRSRIRATSCVPKPSELVVLSSLASVGGYSQMFGRTVDARPRVVKLVVMHSLVAYTYVDIN